jgi:hypothetical protein
VLERLERRKGYGLKENETGQALERGVLKEIEILKSKGHFRKSQLNAKASEKVWFGNR